MSYNGAGKMCSRFKAVEGSALNGYFIKTEAFNCKSCVYFSSRNCGMDSVNTIYLTAAD